MEAVIPDEDATSKNVSGVVSPNPNLPSEVEEKMNLEIELSWNRTSLLNIQSPVTVSFCDRDAGPPLPQSNLTNDWEPVLVMLKCESTKEMLVTWAKAEVISVPTSRPNGKEVVSVSVPQEKTPLVQVSLPVTELQVERPEP